MTDKLEQAAQVYATLAKEIKNAQRNHDKARTELDNLHIKQEAAEKELRAAVGLNIPRKAFVFGGIVVTVDHSSGIHVYEAGEELR